MKGETMHLQLFRAVHTIFGHQFTLTPCPIAQQGAMLRPMWMDVPRSHLSLWVIGDARFRPSCIFLSLPFSLYTHNTHEIFTQSILPWTISVAQLVPRVEVLRWRRRRRIYAMYAISLLLLLSSTSAMIFIDSGALLREESMEDGKMPGPCFQRFANF